MICTQYLNIFVHICKKKRKKKKQHYNTVQNTADGTTIKSRLTFLFLLTLIYFSLSSDQSPVGDDLFLQSSGNLLHIFILYLLHEQHCTFLHVNILINCQCVVVVG